MSSTSNVRAGFVGLGTMGLGMARNLAAKGFPLSLTNRTMEKAIRLASDLAGGPLPRAAPPTPAAGAAPRGAGTSRVPRRPPAGACGGGPGGGTGAPAPPPPPRPPRR